MLEAVKGNEIFKCCEKILLIVIPNIDDIIITKNIPSNCDSTHDDFQLPSSSNYLNVINDYIQQITSSKKSFQSQNKNVSVIFSFFPNLNLSENIESIFQEQKKEMNSSDLPVCTCEFSGIQKEIECYDLLSIWYRNLVDKLNQCIFTMNLTQYQWKDCHRFFNFTPYCVKYLKKKWIPRSIDANLINAYNLNDSLYLFLYGIKSSLEMEFISEISTKDIQDFKKSNFKVYVIGDKWLESVLTRWPQLSVMKPFFCVDSLLNLEQLETMILSLTRDNEKALVICSLGMTNFLNFMKYPVCSNHQSQGHIIPKKELLNDTTKFCADLFKSLEKMKSEIHKRRSNCMLAFTTCFPLDMFHINNYLDKIHYEKTEHNVINALTDVDSFTYFNTCLKKAILDVNSKLIEMNQDTGLNSCDLFKLCENQILHSDYIIPFYEKNVAPMPYLSGKLTEFFKQYIENIRVKHIEGHLTFKSSTYDLEYNESATKKEILTENKILATKKEILETKKEDKILIEKIATVEQKYKIQNSSTEESNEITSTNTKSKGIVKKIDVSECELKKVTPILKDKILDKKLVKLDKKLSLHTEAFHTLKKKNTNVDDNSRNKSKAGKDKNDTIKKTSTGVVDKSKNKAKAVISQSNKTEVTSRKKNDILKKRNTDTYRTIIPVVKNSGRNKPKLNEVPIVKNNEFSLYYSRNEFGLKHSDIRQNPRFRSRMSRSKSRNKRSKSRDKMSISKSRNKRSRSRNRRSRSRNRRSRSRNRRSRSRNRRSRSRNRRSRSRNGRSRSRNIRSRSRNIRSRSTNRWSRSTNWRSRSRNIRSRSTNIRSRPTNRWSRSTNIRSRSTSIRSRSRNRRSRSINWRSRSRNWRSRSRNWRSRSRNLRSRSRNLRSRSRNLRSRSRNWRSRSRNWRSKSRSKTSQCDSYENKLREDTNRYSTDINAKIKFSPKRKTSAKEEALESLQEIHFRECDLYRANPYLHPDHDRHYRIWNDKRSQFPLEECFPWEYYWQNKIEEIFETSWIEKKSQCLSLLPRPESSSSSDSDSRHKSKKKKKKKKKRKKRHRSCSSEEEINKPLTDDETNDADEDVHSKIENFMTMMKSNTCDQSSSSSHMPQATSYKPPKDERQEDIHMSTFLSEISDKYKSSKKRKISPKIEEIQVSPPRRREMKRNMSPDDRWDMKRKHSPQREQIKRKHSPQREQIKRNVSPRREEIKTDSSHRRESLRRNMSPEGYFKGKSSSRVPFPGLGMDHVQQKIDNFIMSDKKLRSSEIRSERGSQSDICVEDVTGVLNEISDRFGALGVSVEILHEQVTKTIADGADPMICIDEDATILLSLIETKMKKQIQDNSWSFVQKAITQESLNRLTPFLKLLKNKPVAPTNKFNIDLDVIASATLHEETMGVVNFIKNALAYKQIINYTPNDVMKLYLEIKQLHIKLESNSKDRVEHSSAGPSSFETNPLSDKEKKLKQIERHFLALPMLDRIQKFANFKRLPFEEKNFLLNHIDSLEKTDLKLAMSLRWTISKHS